MKPERKFVVSFSGEKGNYQGTINFNFINVHCFHLRQHSSSTFCFASQLKGQCNYSDMHEGSTIELKQNWITRLGILIRAYKSVWHTCLKASKAAR